MEEDLKSLRREDLEAMVKYLAEQLHAEMMRSYDGPGVGIDDEDSVHYLIDEAYEAVKEKN
jgi:hypothetical protein